MKNTVKLHATQNIEVNVDKDNLLSKLIQMNYICKKYNCEYFEYNYVVERDNNGEPYYILNLYTYNYHKNDYYPSGEVLLDENQIKAYEFCKLLKSLVENM